MSWVAFFWILYGAGSTLFVIYLFKLGNRVASNRKELVRQEIERFRNGQSDDTGLLDPATTHSSSEDTAEYGNDRLHIQRIYQPDAEHVAVQGVRDGATCVINLPVGKGDGTLRPHPERCGSGAEKRQ